jgi:hypothetical protein
MDENIPMNQGERPNGLRTMEENFKRFANFANCLFNSFKSYEKYLADPNEACKVFAKDIEKIRNDTFLNIKDQIQNLSSEKLITPVLIQHLQGMDNLYEEMRHYNDFNEDVIEDYIKRNHIIRPQVWTNKLLKELIIGSLEKIMQEIFYLFTCIFDEYPYFLEREVCTKLYFKEQKFQDYILDFIGNINKKTGSDQIGGNEITLNYERIKSRTEESRKRLEAYFLRLTYTDKYNNKQILSKADVEYWLSTEFDGFVLAPETDPNRVLKLNTKIGILNYFIYQAYCSFQRSTHDQHLYCEMLIRRSSLHKNAKLKSLNSHISDKKPAKFPSYLEKDLPEEKPS